MKPSSLIKMGLGALKHKLTGKRIPMNVMFSLTNRCTSRCAYCQKSDRKQDELATAEVLQAIEDMYKAGTRRIGFWGGEPLMRKDIGTIIDKAASLGIYTTLDTNGYLLAERIDELKNLDHILLSIDGNEEAHDKNREPGSFKKTMKALELALSRGYKVGTITVLTKNNIKDIDFVVDLSNKYNLMANFQILHHNDVLGTNPGWMFPTNEEYKAAFEKLMKLKKGGAKIITSSRFLQYMINWGDYKVTRKKEKLLGIPCLAGSLYCNIDTDGSVYPCSILIGKVDVKNLRDAGFKKAFEALGEIPCHSCAATCFTEYNLLFSFNVKTIYQWVKEMFF